VHVDDIIMYHYKSIWSLQDYDNFQPHTRWNYILWNQVVYLGYTPVAMGKLSLRQKKVFDYLKNRYPEWGSKTALHPQQDMENDAWKLDAAASTTFDDGWQEGLPLGRPMKQQKLEDEQE
jgi:hypothetical protein